MPVRAKRDNSKIARQSLGAVFKLAAVGGILYVGSLFYYNAGTPGDSKDAIKALVNESRYDYLGQTAAKPLIISFGSVYKTDTDQLSLTGDSASKFIAAYNKAGTDTDKWTSTVSNILSAIAAKPDARFTFTFTDQSGDIGLLKTASRFKLGFMPSASASAWPEMTIRRDEQGAYSGIITLGSWDQAARIDAVRTFLKELASAEDKTRHARRESDDNLTGVYKLQREDDGRLTVYKQEGAALAAAANTAAVAPEKITAQTAVAPYEADSGNANLMKIWSRIDYLDQLAAEQKFPPLSLALRDAVKTADRTITFRSGAADTFINTYNRLRPATDTWVKSVGALIDNLPTELVKVGSFYRTGIVPGAEAKVTLAPNENGILYATMTIPNIWDDKTRDAAIRAFLSKMKEDRNLGKVVAGSYTMIREANGNLGVYSLRPGEAMPPVSPAL